MNTNTSTSTSGASPPVSPPTVAVIGGGPGAMFFCHSLETQKREVESKGGDTSAFPTVVKVFERAEGPGGVWRADRSHNDNTNTPNNANKKASSCDDFADEKKDDDDDVETKKRKLENEIQNETTPARKQPETTNMYAALWTNGPKEQFEFYDYTFRDHFGDVPMPTFLPRKHVLDYMEARVTKRCPDFFERYFRFETTVQNVRYLEETKKFRVCTYSEITKEEHVEFFDKCIWAAGIDGTKNIPRPTAELLEKGGFPGRAFHSGDTATFKEDVEGKTVLMIGGGYSAEDLAVMAVKEGVSKVYIIVRYEESACSNNTRYPYDKVEVLEEFAMESVQGRDITVNKVRYDLRHSTYRFCGDDNDDSKRVLSDIDTVIFCTGYKMNLSMLDPALCSAISDSDYLSVSKDWSPKEDAVSQKLLGDEKFRAMRPHNHKVLTTDYYFLHDNCYMSAFCIDNPSMMYMLNCHDVPLMNCEIFGWTFAKVLSNQIPLPSPKEMRDENLDIVGQSLQCNSLRYDMDWIYREEIDKAVKDDPGKVDDDDWEDAEPLYYMILGRQMLRFEYPVSYINNKDVSNLEDCEWSEYSKFTTLHNDCSTSSRTELAKVVYDTNKEKDGWKTFRDNFLFGASRSFFSGIKPIPLPKPWEELHEDDVLW